MTVPAERPARPGACAGEVWVTRGGRTAVKSHVRWWQAGYRVAQHDFLTLVIEMLKAGHEPDWILHAVCHTAMSGQMVDRLDGTDDIESVVSEGWKL